MKKGEKVEVRITYPKIDGFVDYFKFNYSNLKWDLFRCSKKGNTVVLELVDGGVGDEDGITNGIIEDDGGVSSWKMEAGTVTLLDTYDIKNFTHVTFTQKFDKVPVIFALPTNEGDQPCALRVKNITTTGFDIVQVEPYGVDGEHISMTIHYLAIEPGEHYLPDGTRILVGKINTTKVQHHIIYNPPPEGWEHVTFDEPFSTTPIVIAMIQTMENEENNVPDEWSKPFLTVAIQNVDRYGFDIALERSESYPGSVTRNETIGYLVMDSGISGCFEDNEGNEVCYETIRSDDIIKGWNNGWTRIYFSKTYSSPPLVFATKNTHDGGDGGWLRRRTVTTTYVELCVDEDTAQDSERSHTTERAGILILSRSFNVLCISVSGRVLEDLSPLGVNNGEDRGIQNVQVALFKDNTTAGTQGILDSNDELVATTVTNSTGYYNFTITDTSALYFVAVNSSTVNTTRGLNSGYTINDIWAEQTYQVEWNGSAWVLVEKFGGQNPNVSDNWSAGHYEHWVAVNCSNYNGESIDFGFSFDVVVNTKDVDDDFTSNRTCQGCLRQFIQNANAIRGENHMRFVPMVLPNSGDTNGKWWTITVNKSLGALPAITDDNTIIDGTAYYPNGTIRDENPGDAYPETRVGIGADAIPNSGDEYIIPPIKKVELAINGSKVGEQVLKVYANNSKVLNVSIYGGKFYKWNDYNGASIQISGQNITIENCILNRYPNGTLVLDSWVAIDHRDGATCNGLKIKHNLISWSHPVHLGYKGMLKNIVIEDNIILGRSPGVMFGNPQQKVSGAIIRHNFINCGKEPHDIGKPGWASIETRNANVSNLIIEENTIIPNDVVNSTAISLGENVRDVIIRYNLIRDARGSAVVLSHYEATQPYAKNVTITKNSIINSGRIAIDFFNDNVTLNDGQLDASQPNYGIDYPVITYAEFNGTHLYIKGFINDESAGAGSSNFTNAIVEVYLVKNSTGGDNLIGNNLSSNGSTLDKCYGEGWIYLGSLTADANGEFEGWINVAGKGVEWSALITATATLNGIGTSEFGPNYLLIKRINVSTSITIFWQNDHYNATIAVTAFNKTQYGVMVYWLKPENFTINSMSGDYNYTNNSGNIYYWRFDVIKAGETKYVYLNLSASNEYSLSEAYVIGVDPNGGDVI